MKSFKTFLFEAKSPEELARIQQAKVDSYVGKYMKYHQNHPTVRSNPEEAKKLIAASMPLQSSHEEAIYASRNFLDSTLKPGEDDNVIKYGINRFKGAKKQGKTTESLASHTHDSLMQHLNSIDPIENDNTVYPNMDDLSEFHIGDIHHPTHGKLRVFQITTHKIPKTDKFGLSWETQKQENNFQELSKRLKKQTCAQNNFCTFREHHGDISLKHYSHGHGMLYYVDKNNRIVFGHGFGDRGIVNPDNTLVSKNESSIIHRQTSSLLSGRHKELYDMMTDPVKSSTYENQKKIYDEFGEKHAVPHFLSPNTNTHPKILEEILNKHKDYYNSIFSHPNVNDDLLTNASTHSDYLVRAAAAAHPKATKEHLDKAINDSHGTVRSEAARNSNATKEHLDKALNDRNEYVRIEAAENPNATKEHLDQALNDSNEYVRSAAARNSNATKEHLDKAIKDSDKLVRSAAAAHPNATKEHLDKALNDYTHIVRIKAAEHPKATKEHLDKALNDSDEYIRLSAARNSNATKEHLDKALNDSDEYVRSAAAAHPNATKEHLDKAINDSHGTVRSAAARNSNATKEHLDKALNDSYESVRAAAAKNPNATQEHLDKAIDDSDEFVRMEAVAHPKATQKHLDKGLNDHHEDVREAARKRLARQINNPVNESLYLTINKILKTST